MTQTTRRREARPALHGFRIVACAVAIALSAVSSPAEVDEQPPLRPQVEQRIATLDADTTLRPEVREQALRLLRDALLALESADLYTEQAAQFEEAAKGSPARVEEYRRRLAAVESGTDTGSAALLEDVERELAATEALLRTSERDLRDARADRRAREVRRRALPEESRAAAQELAAHETDRMTDPSGEASVVTAARLLQRQAASAMASADIARLGAEFSSYEAREPLLALRVEVHEAETEVLRQRVARLTALRESRRGDEIAELRAELTAAATDFADVPIVRTLTEDALALLSRHYDGATAVSARAEGIRRELERQRSTLDRLRAAREKIDLRLQVSGISATIGLMLREERARLPDVARLRSRVRGRQGELTRLQLEIIELQEQQAAAPLIGQAVASLREAAATTTADGPRLAARVRRLYERVLQLRQASIADLLSSYDLLVALDSVERELAEELSQFKSFIDERVLWSRSANLLGTGDLPAAAAGLAGLVSAENRAAIASAFRADTSSAPLLWIAALTMVAILVVTRRIAAGRLVPMATSVAERPDAVFQLSLQALLWTVPLALAPAAAPLFVGARLMASSGTGLVAACALATVWLGLAILAVEFVRSLCRPAGVGPAYLRWAADGMPRIRALARQWLLLVAPAMALALLADNASTREVPLDALSRLAFLVAMLASAWVAARLLGKRGPVFADLRPQNPLRRLQPLAVTLGTGLALGLAAASTAGYHFTAIQLERRLRLTVVCLATLWVVGQMAQLWLAVARQRVVLARMRERRAALAAAVADDVGHAGEGVTVAEPEISSADIRRQTQSLVRTVLAAVCALVLYSVWAGVLPALSVVQKVALWGTSTESGGSGVVTLGSVMFALMVVALTGIGARNVPGFLEIAILRRLPLNAGSRYAAVQLARYAIAVVGVFLVAPALGLHWDSVQWLLAAMTVGLGFGLQEIFANFVSGVIILFEQPIRLGDTVTIGEVTGTVSRIRIRATTITDWERRELIVPNREFITGRLVNWTLSDDLLRVKIAVGVAYGSDIPLARKLLLAAPVGNEQVLVDPPPRAVFLSFGDSSLALELRVFVRGLDAYLTAVDVLHERIDRAFKEAGIVIAFPQQDLHIDASAGPIPVRLTPAAADDGDDQPEPARTADRG